MKQIDICQRHYEDYQFYNQNTTNFPGLIENGTGKSESRPTPTS